MILSATNPQGHILQYCQCRNIRSITLLLYHIPKTRIISTYISILSSSSPDQNPSSVTSLILTFIKFTDAHNDHINKKSTVTSEVPVVKHYDHATYITSYAPIRIIYIYPSVVPTIEQSHKRTWVPTLVSSICTTTYPSQSPQNNLSYLSYTIPSLEHYFGSISIPSYFTMGIPPKSTSIPTNTFQ